MARRPEDQHRNGESQEGFFNTTFAQVETAWRVVAEHENLQPNTLRGISDYGLFEHQPDIHPLVWTKPGVIERFTGRDHGFLPYTGPPAGGKDTIKIGALALLPKETLDVVVTHTTKPRVRTEDVHGEMYYFVSEDEFKEMKQQGEFAEDVLQWGYHYGTSKYALRKSLSGPAPLSLWRGEYRGWNPLQRLLTTEYPDVPFAWIFVLPGTSMSKVIERIFDKRGKEFPIRRVERAVYDIINGGNSDICIVNPPEKHGPTQATEAFVATIGKIREAQLATVVTS